MGGRRELAEVIARELARDILANIDKYRLRHRCVLKVTEGIVARIIRERYDVDVYNAWFLPRVLRALARVLRDFGYRAMIRRVSGSIIYYFVPRDCNEVIDGAEDFEKREERIRMARGRKKEAVATTEEV